MHYPLSIIRNTLLLLALLASTALSQPLELRIHSIDAGALPQMRLKVAVTRGGVALTQPGRAVFSLLDNGQPMQIDVDCPDSSIMNNVALVLDNSGSLGGLAFDSLKAGTHSVVDSLRDNDATAMYNFSNGGQRVLDFTTDKAILHSTVSAMTLGGNTPLYQTIDMALRDLDARVGRKYCIVFTDGVDNASSVLWSDLIPRAQAAGIRVYIIGFGNTELSDDILSTIARDTGGRYWRIFAPALIAGILRSIASEIASPYCTINYEATGCADSLRILNLSATLDGQSAATDTAYVSPFRADTLYASVVAPDRILPGDRALVYIALQPGLHTGLELSFRFLLRYDPALLSATPPTAITVGTITQNTAARVRQLRPGVLQFSAEFAVPGMSQGNLIGIQLRHAVGDSSRPVVLTLDSLTLTAGCPTTVILISDTMEVCQCEQSFIANMHGIAIATHGEEVTVPLAIPLPGSSVPVLLRTWLHYAATALRFSGVDDAAGEGWDAQIDEANGRLRIDLYTRSNADSLLPRLRFLAHGEKKPMRTFVGVDSMKLYADCCYNTGSSGQWVWVDGRCEFLVRRKAVATIVSTYPNPAYDMLHVATSITSTETAPALLELFDARGQLVRSVHLSTEISERITSLGVQDLPPGRYTIRLSTAASISARTVMVVR
ncbi:MAG: VWA domain-containing protein [Bacteroidia bacterium]|nr:VWA domain-containing protein [Bacteroidia bacterium]